MLVPSFGAWATSGLIGSSLAAFSLPAAACMMSICALFLRLCPLGNPAAFSAGSGARFWYSLRRELWEMVVCVIYCLCMLAVQTNWLLSGVAALDTSLPELFS